MWSFSRFLILFCLFTLFSGTPAFAQAIPGDVNGDNDVNITDATALTRQILGFDPKMPATGDINVDGTINIQDVVLVIHMILGKPFGQSLSANSGRVGETITITGLNFDPVAANNIVSFGGGVTTATSVTMTFQFVTAITVTVPPSAVTGEITFAVGGVTSIPGLPFTVIVSGSQWGVSRFGADNWGN
jgi:hypothetical protein